MNVNTLAFLAVAASASLARASDAKDAGALLAEIQARKAARKKKRGANGGQSSPFSKHEAGSFARRGDAERALEGEDALPDVLMSMAELQGPHAQNGDPLLPPYPTGDPDKLCPMPMPDWMGPPPAGWEGPPPPPEWGPHPPPESEWGPPPPPPGWTPWSRRAQWMPQWMPKSSKSKTSKTHKSSKGWRSDGPRAKPYEPWDSAGPKAKPDEPEKCAPVGDACDGYGYYKLGWIEKTGNPRSSWTELAMLAGNAEATTYPEGGLENCMLAPIPSLEEFTNLLLEFDQLLDGLDAGPPGSAVPIAYIGVVKKATDVIKDNDGKGSRANWSNLDGTSAEVCDALWPDGQPDNNDIEGLPETRLALIRFDGSSTVTGLQDVADRLVAPFLGLYKCCGRSIAFSSCAAMA